ncbi:hypothetical protein Dimus_039002 [Dionaea muscipula]
MKTLRSDRGAKYLLDEFMDDIVTEGITPQLSAPSMPWQNGVADRRYRTLVEMVRFMMSFADSPISFWGHTQETTICMLSLVPSKLVPNTPKEKWSECKPNLEHLQVWSSPADVLEGHANKLESMTSVCLFVGHPGGMKRGLFYRPDDKKRSLLTPMPGFLEQDYILNHNPKINVILEELRGVGQS